MECQSSIPEPPNSFGAYSLKSELGHGASGRVPLASFLSRKARTAQVRVQEAGFRHALCVEPQDAFIYEPILGSIYQRHCIQWTF